MRTVYPQPDFTEADLVALLATRQFIYVDLITIEPKVGDPLRYCSASRNIVCGSVDDLIAEPGTLLTQVYTSSGVKVSGVKCKSGIGVEADEQTLHMDYHPGLTYYGSSYAEAIKRGRFDGSVVKRDRVFAADWAMAARQPTWVGSVRMFQGRFSTVNSVGRSSAEFSVKSNLILLNMKMPRRKYQAGCNHVFGDPGCGIDRTDFEVLTAVGAGSDALTLFTPDADDTMLYGTIQIDDVYNVTQIRTIKEVVAGSKIVLAYPLDFTPDTGEQFSMLPGCSRTFEDGVNNCTTYWGADAKDHFQGFPFIPVPETAF